MVTIIVVVVIVQTQSAHGVPQAGLGLLVVLVVLLVVVVVVVRPRPRWLRILIQISIAMSAAAPRSRRPGRRGWQWLQCRLVVGLVRLIHAPAAASSQQPLGDGPADRRSYLRTGGGTMRLRLLCLLLLGRVPAARRGYRGVGPARVGVFHGVGRRRGGNMNIQPLAAAAASSTGNVGNARRSLLVVAFAPAVVGARHASRATALSRDTLSSVLVMRDVFFSTSTKPVDSPRFLSPSKGQAGSAICRVCPEAQNLKKLVARNVPLTAT